jgi:hypothetical protein
LKADLPESTPFTYRAFVSYSHRDNAWGTSALKLLDAQHLAPQHARGLRPGQERDHGGDSDKARARDCDDYGRQDEARHHRRVCPHHQALALREANDTPDEDLSEGELVLERLAGVVVRTARLEISLSRSDDGLRRASRT